jgi:hypothetical protein
MEVCMRKLVTAALAIGVALTATTAASAREGCGPGGHRGPYGHCRPNRGPVIVERGPLVVDRFYQGRGYWDGRRYWQHRERHHGGWRYR